MKLKKTLTALLMAVSLMWVSVVQAGETTFKGVSVDYGSAVKTTSGDNMILTYNASGLLKLSGPVKARVLLVAGGGSGSSGGSNSNKSGYGGQGGVVLDEADVLLSGDCDITVGAGGAGVKGASNSRTQGAPGGNSTIINSFSKSIIRQAYGGGGGGDATPSGSGTASNITGSNRTYGANGGNKTSGTTGTAAAANTGNGGQGGYGGNSSGKGGSGVVIVRLTSVVAGANLRDLVLPLDKMSDEFRDASDQPMSFVFSEVTCKSSADRVVAAVETADGKLGLQGLYPGRARVTIVKGEKTYLVNVAVVQLVTGSFRIGAYEVAVTNASEVKSVDGDLVITYLNTDAAVDKSFTLPQATTGRLLAVGGGGAGGQDSERNTSYGLPGGGGAGGLVKSDSQDFAAATYAVTVGAGGVAPRSLTKKNGANGGDSKVEGNGTAIAEAMGGGGGGARSAGSNGGCGGGGSYSGGTKNGGSSIQAASGSGSGAGKSGGAGKDKQYGAGGGGAGDGGTACDTSSSSSGKGGTGVFCDITGESLEYARGGDGGVPRVKEKYTSGDKEYWVEAEDGKPGIDGRGNGGGGSGHYGSSATYAGSGGSGVVVVRIPPYKTTVEDALKGAFGDQPVTVSGSSVTLNGDVTGPIEIPDNLGAVAINLNGRAIVGANGAEGDDITSGGNGQAALAVVAHAYASEANAATEISVMGTGSLKGGNGGKGYPGGAGAPALSADGFTVTVADGIAVMAGTAGESYVQHPHKWAYTVKDNKIVAYCVAEDGEPCSYRDQSRGPFVAVSAADAAYTAMRYDELTSVNGITPVTGIVVAPETYVGRDGTDYPESSTPPREQGAYTVSMQLGDLRITSDFTITEPKPAQGSVYQAWKTAERKGRDVQIALSATFDGSKAINDGNVLFLGSRCSAHSMDKGTVESSVNALARYANVRWYAYGSKEPSNNKVNMLTEKGETVSDGTVTLVGGNHFVFKEMMDDLYAELVEKKNRTDGYDLLILEFDGDLLGRNGESPYQLVYSLPEGWTDEKAALLRAAMSRYYAEDRVVWIVPDVNQKKDDPGWTGEYPWTSNPEFIWQRAFLNATETEGYRCPLQKNYEDTGQLVAYLQEVLVGHFFSNAIIKDTLANGLTIKKVTPQMRSDGGIWRNFEGGPSHFTIPEPRSDTTVKADVETEGRQVTVTFDMREEQAWACEHNQVIGDDFRVVIDAELDGFFNVGEGEWQETNEGPATFTFTESNLDDDEDDFTITIEKESPKIQNVKLTPDYTSEDVVKIYDGKGTNIVVKPIAPEPDEAVIRYSLDEHGTYTDTLALTEVCDKTKVWFEITDKVGEFTTVTNFATVTILPRVVVEQAEDAEKTYDGNPLIQPAHSNVLSRAIAEAEQMYPGRGASAAGFVPGEGFANVPMTSDSQQTEIGSHANTIDKTAVTVNEKTDKNNYVFIYLPGTLTVTPSLPMGIEAFPVEKFYDAEPTNITYVVTNATGAAIADATVSLREKGTDPWIPAADFALYVDATNVTVEVKAEKSGFTPVTAEATVIVKPRPVTLVAGSDSKVYDGTPLTCDDFEVKDDDTTAAIPGYGFVKEEGVASVTMTDNSTITDPGSVPNEIASETAKAGTKLGRNYVVATEPGTLTVTAATMGIQAFPAEKFYDAEPTNVTWVVTNAQGGVISDATIFLREQGTDPWIPAADFTLYVDTTNVTVEVKAEKSGFTPVTAEATVIVKPRPVTLVAGSDSKTYDGTPLTCDDFEVKDDDTTAAIPGYGFVKEEGIVSVTMTDDSTITNPGSVPNVIATEVAKGGTKLERNYVVSTNPGTLTVTAALIRSYDDVFIPGGNTPENIEAYLEEILAGSAIAFGVEVWTNDVPAVTTVGTNIVVRFKGLTDEDTAKSSLEWSTSGEEGTWSEIEPCFTEICATQVWCRVSCPNYAQTNITAFVYIKSRESRTDDAEATKEDKLQPNSDPSKPTTEEQTKKVVEDIAKNDNRDAGDPDKFDPSKPVWDGSGEQAGYAHGVQTDAEVNLKVTSICNLPDEKREKAEGHLDNEIKDAARGAGIDPTRVRGRNVDVKLLYTRTYSDGTKSVPIDIGASNTEIIPFTIAVEFGADEELLRVLRYNGEERTEFHAGTGMTTEHFELSADRTRLTIYAKTHSEFVLVTGTKEQRDCGPERSFVYDVKAVAMTTVAAKNAVAKEYNPFLTRDRGTGDELIYRQIATKPYSGLIWGCSCDAIAGATKQVDIPIYGGPDSTTPIGYTNHWEGSLIWADESVNGVYRPVYVGPKQAAGGSGVWTFLNAVEALGNKCEGSWVIRPEVRACDGSVGVGRLAGSGFGYLQFERPSSAYVLYMTGYFAGWMPASRHYEQAHLSCLYCGGSVIGGGCRKAEVWDFCRCVPFMDEDSTACLGQWTIQLNATLSEAISQSSDALDVFPIPKELKDAVLAERSK